MSPTRLAGLVLAVGLLTGQATVAGAELMGTAFTYQGYLTDGGSPATGVYEFEFRLYDALAGGNPVGNSFSLRSVEVDRGLFTVALDFEGGIFTGDARWLQIAVRPSGSTDPHTILTPRQRLTPTPYALYTPTAGSVPDGITGSGTANYLAKFTGTDTIGNSAVYEAGGKVGIGTPAPSHALHVESSGAKAIFGESTASGGMGVHGLASAFSGGSFAVYGENYSSGGVGVSGIAAMGSGINYGVYGQSQSDVGRGVYGLGAHVTGSNYGVYGQTNSPDGWAGYFVGRGYFSGNVGIGTTSPSASLEVTNPGNQHGIYAYTNYIAVRGIKTGTGSFPGVEGQTESTSSDASGVRGKVTSTSPGSLSAGVYGINAGTGSNGAGVRGTHDGSGAGVYGASSAGPGGKFVGAENNGTTAAVEIVSGGQTMLLDGNEIDALVTGLYLNNNSALNVFLAGGGGGVGIRTTNIPAGVALAVDGKGLFEEVEVQLSQDWPDYVFDEDYQLMPLTELAASVRQARHLPGIPSADEVKKNGVGLGRMQANLLRKVEELTLYVIELNDQLDDVSRENGSLRKRIARLEDVKNDMMGRMTGEAAPCDY